MSQKILTVDGSFISIQGPRLDINMAGSRTALNNYLFIIAASNWRAAWGKMPTGRQAAVKAFFSQQVTPGGKNEYFIEEWPSITDEAASSKAEKAMTAHQRRLNGVAAR